MVWAYVCRLFGCVFRSSLTARDVIAFVFGVAALLVLWLTSDEHGDALMEIVSLELIAGLSLVLVLRSICAPYAVWRELIAYVTEPNRELDGAAR